MPDLPPVSRESTSHVSEPIKYRLPDYLKPFKAIIRSGFTTPIVSERMYKLPNGMEYRECDLAWHDLCQAWYRRDEQTVNVPLAILDLHNDQVLPNGDIGPYTTIPDTLYGSFLSSIGVEYCSTHRHYHSYILGCPKCRLVIPPKGSWPSCNGETRFGVEFEYCNVNHQVIPNPFRWVAQNFFKTSDYGCAEELCTRPMAWEDLTCDDMRKFIEHYVSQGATHFNGREEQAGMHIHISREQLSIDQYKLICKWFQIHHEEVKALSGRTTQYSWHYAWTEGRDTKYKPIHDHSRGETWELRLFSARVWTQYGWPGYMLCCKFAKNLPLFERSDLGMSLANWIIEHCDLTHDETQVMYTLLGLQPYRNVNIPYNLDELYAMREFFNDSSNYFVLKYNEQYYSFVDLTGDFQMEITKRHIDDSIVVGANEVEFVSSDIDQSMSNTLCQVSGLVSLPKLKDW